MAWQSMFATLPAKDALLPLFALLLSLLVLLGVKSLNEYFLQVRSQQDAQRIFARLQGVFVFDSFKEAFSSGTLHPKLF
jgi:hypothetical protein